VKLLIEYGMDVNQEDENGYHIFNFTCEVYSDFTEKAMHILEAGFDIRKLERKAIDNIGSEKIDLFLDANMMTLLKLYQNRKRYKFRPLGKL
jgi:hypothetical protein